MKNIYDKTTYFLQVHQVGSLVIKIKENKIPQVRLPSFLFVK
jgi:hypothetical protein